jgi:bile acid:Na+ symporter, BASS family
MAAMIRTVLPYLLQGSLFLLVFSIGLRSQWSDVVYAFRRPALLLRAMVAINVIFPLTAIALCALLPIAPYTQAGLAIMAVSPLAPLAPAKMLKSGGEHSYVVGIYIAVILTSVVIVPATAAILDPLLPHGVTIPMDVVGRYVLETVLAPILLGVTLASAWPGSAIRFGELGGKIALAIIVPVFLLLVLKFGQQLLALAGDGTLFVIFATIAVGLVAGHWLGGPEPANRLSLAQATVTRHPGIAALLAQRHSDDPRLMLAAVMLLLGSMILSAVYQAWWTKHYRPALPATNA